MTSLTKKAIGFGSLVVFITLFSLPVFVSAQDSSPNTGITYECVQKDSAGNNVYGNCGFTDLINATMRVVDWGIKFALAFSVVVIAYAGFNYMISGDNQSKRKEANQMLLKVFIGIAWMMAAWLVVTLIARALLSQQIIDIVPFVKTN